MLLAPPSAYHVAFFENLLLLCFPHLVFDLLVSLEFGELVVGSPISAGAVILH